MNAQCPKCGSDKNFREVKIEDKGGGDIFFLFGLMAYLAHRESFKNKVLCENCGLVFTPKKKRNLWADLALFLLLLILFFAVILYGVYVENPTIFK